MSTQRGNASRTRKQKHTNVRAFKNNLYGDTPLTKVLNNLNVTNVCARCKDILEWKIKYNKYKPLTAPAKCTKCLQKNVKYAYHTMCQPCAEKHEVCAKCAQQKEIVTKPEPSTAEKARLDAQFQQELKLLPERKRRTFLRYLERLDKEKEEEEGSEENEGASEKVPKDWMKEAERKLEQLKLEAGKKDGDSDDDFDDFDDFDDEDDFSDDDE